MPSQERRSAAMIAPSPPRSHHFRYCEAVEDSDLPGPDRHLLTVMVRTARDEVASRDVSVPALMRRTGYARRTVKYCLRRLEAAGWLSPVRAGDGLAVSYRFHVPGLLSGQPASPVDNPQGGAPDAPVTGRTGAPDAPGGGHQVHRGGASGAPLDSRATARALIPLYLEPSSIERMRTRLRQLVPDLTPDDDEISIFLEHIERTHHPTRGPVAYLHGSAWDRAAVLTAWAEAKAATTPTPGTGAGTTTDAEQAKRRSRELDEAMRNRSMDCPHGTPAGLIPLPDGRPRCLECRADAQQPRTPASSAPPAAWPRPGRVTSSAELSALRQRAQAARAAAVAARTRPGATTLTPAPATA